MARSVCLQVMITRKSENLLLAKRAYAVEIQSAFVFGNLRGNYLPHWVQTSLVTTNVAAIGTAFFVSPLFMYTNTFGVNSLRWCSALCWHECQTTTLLWCARFCCKVIVACCPSPDHCHDCVCTTRWAMFPTMKVSKPKWPINLERNSYK